MTTYIYNENGVSSLGSISGHVDLNAIHGISINPPPADGECQVCGRPLEKLKPFGKAGDPLVGDFGGELLVKIWRPEGPYDEEAVKAFDEAEKRYSEEGFKRPMDWMIQKFGKKKADELSFSAQLYGQIGSSWECRDCIVLDDQEIWQRQGERSTDR